MSTTTSPAHGPATCGNCSAPVSSATGFCEHCGESAVPVVPEGPAGLGGWLVLVGFGLVVSPLVVLGMIANDLLPIFLEGYWPLLTDPASDAYHPLWGPLIIFELVGNFVQVVALCGALVLFFRKSSYFPRVAIAIYLGVFVFLMADYLLADLIPAVAAEESDGVPFVVEGGGPGALVD